MAFNPPEVHSPAGAPVLWLFQDGDIPHTVTADNGSFDSGHKVNDEYRLRFDHPGTYSYHCTLHPDMKGKVIVH
jgi:plastocyanin